MSSESETDAPIETCKASTTGVCLMMYEGFGVCGNECEYELGKPESSEGGHVDG